MNKKSYTGKNIIDLPQDFTVVQLESTDLNPMTDNITEFSARKYKNNKLVNQLDNENVMDNPVNAFASLSDFIGNDIVVVNRTAYFWPFIGNAYLNFLNRPFPNDIVDIQRLFKYIENSQRAKFDIMIKFFQLNTTHNLVARDDIESVSQVYQNLKEDFNKKELTIKDIQPKHEKFRISDLENNPEKHDSTNEFYGKVVSASGAISSYTRKEIAQLVTDIGGKFQITPGKKTDYFILGELKDGISNKEKKAEEYDVEILMEEDFLNIIANYNN